MRKIKILAIFSATMLLLAGCGLSYGEPNQKVLNDGGIWKSIDKGGKWTQKVAMPTAAGVQSIGFLNVNQLAADPTDNQVIYATTPDKGTIFTLDGAESWLRPAHPHADMVSVNGLAVDSKDHCNLYAVGGNKIFKSSDCAREWQRVYFDTDATEIFNSVVVDNYNPAKIYVGGRSGRLITSADHGVSWKTLKKFDNEIKQIVINQKDTRIIYVATDSGGVYRTADSGSNWLNLNDAEFLKKEIKSSRSFYRLTEDMSHPDALFVATKGGLLYTPDGGQSWSAISTLNDFSKTKIYALASDPENSNGVYYATDKTFYKSLDGGKSWVSQKLPTTRAASSILVDFKDPKVIYLSTFSLSK